MTRSDRHRNGMRNLLPVLFSAGVVTIFGGIMVGLMLLLITVMSLPWALGCTFGIMLCCIGAFVYWTGYSDG